MQNVPHTPTASKPATSRERLSRLAARMAEHQVQAYYLSPEDEHLNEYLPDCKKRIEWLTGFTGESAPLLVTSERMVLYVDGRFHLQVDAEVDPDVVEACKLGPDTSSEAAIAKTLRSAFQATGTDVRVGYDPFIVSPKRLERLQKALDKSLAVTWVAISGNLVDPLWEDPPPLPATPAYRLDTAITGQSTPDKLAAIRATMAQKQAELLPLTRLDDIAWLYNLRAADIPYNPVLQAYGLISPTQAWLFANPAKCPPALATQLATDGVSVQPYDAYVSVLTEQIQIHPKAWADPDAMTEGTRDLLARLGQPVHGDHPVTMAKALKNPTEIEAMHRANRQASRALIRHLAFVDQAFEAGTRFSEAQLRDHLEALYREEPDFADLSFPTIPGIGTNSAIIHYSHAEPTRIGQDGDFYLIDSGCHYQGGTTDTTRTTVFGTPRRDQIEKYTWVLKAHLAGARLVFPEGTRGYQIDAVCRAPMWSQGLDFAHGTGHGVGAFLNVHEGPNRISKAGNVAFCPGMVTSIEPGYYQAGWGGIRLENLYVVVADPQKPVFLEKPWFAFQSLTLVPFARKLMAPEMLTAEETAWLAHYNHRIQETFSASLSPQEKAWLAHQCQI